MYGDSAYASQKDRITKKTPNARDFTNQRTRNSGIVDEAVRTKSHNKSHIRLCVEHVFAAIKRLRGFGKLHNQGLENTAARESLHRDWPVSISGVEG